MDNLIIINTRLGSPEAEIGRVLIRDGKIAAAGNFPIPNERLEIVDAGGNVVIPGLVDLHVHLREPGYEYKETIASGSRAAAAGGFTTICAMANLNPVPDARATLDIELQAIRQDALVEVLPYAAITKNRLGKELVDFKELAEDVCGFSDDGTGVADEQIMRKAMEEIASTGKPMAEHCEVASLLDGGYIHAGEYANIHNHKGISSESEWREVERNIRLAEETGCHLHLCHISTKESVALIRKAKAKGIKVTAETAAHYLAFCDSDLREDGWWKMNPPLRSSSDREALLQACADGTIDVIASDHAPHSLEEKNKGLENSAMGVVGLEVALPAVYSFAVLTGHLSYERMIEMMAIKPREIFGIKGGMKVGDRADLAIVDFDSAEVIDSKHFLSKGRATPFNGLKLNGIIAATIANGEIVYSRL